MHNPLRAPLAWLASRRILPEAGTPDGDETLKARLRELEQRTQEIMLLGEMNELLQGSQAVEDACAVIARYAPRFFPHGWGAIYLINPTRTLAEARASWGERKGEVSTFEPSSCWAIRTGRPHLVHHSVPRPPCPHVNLPADMSDSFCVPMVAQGEALGVLHLGTHRATSPAEESDDPLSPTTQWLAIAVAQNVALSLANLRLRETLHQQSVRDPLTGLYNRRYLEETMVREEARAKRTRSTLGVILLDVDHFKQFNDTYGHGAGDRVLQAVGRLLKARVRVEDVVCRYGGEEFIVVMPGASLETMQNRAESLRREAAFLALEGLNPVQTPITLSAGIAVFPDHGDGWESVIAAADAALYRAKRDGRDRVVVAGDGEI